MSAETNKAIVRRYLEQVWNQCHPELIEEFFTKDFVYHESVPAGIEGFRAYYD